MNRATPPFGHTPTSETQEAIPRRMLQKQLVTQHPRISDLLLPIIYLLSFSTLCTHVILLLFLPSHELTVEVQFFIFSPLYITLLGTLTLNHHGRPILASQLLVFGIIVEQLLLLYFVVGPIPFTYISITNTTLMAGLILGSRAAVMNALVAIVGILVHGYFRNQDHASLTPIYIFENPDALLFPNIASLAFTVFAISLWTRRILSLLEQNQKRSSDAQKAIAALRQAESKNAQRAHMGAVLSDLASTAARSSTPSVLAAELIPRAQDGFDCELFVMFHIVNKEWTLLEAAGSPLWCDALAKHPKITEEDLKRTSLSETSPWILREESVPLALFTQPTEFPQSMEPLLFPLEYDQRLLGALFVLRPIQNNPNTNQDEFLEILSQMTLASLSHIELLSKLEQTQKLEAVGLLTSSLSHDFNNLLTAIAGNTDMAQLYARDDDDLHHRIGQIQRATKKAASLTQKMLDFTRRRPWNPSSLDVNQTLQELSPLLLSSLSSQIRLVLNLSEANPIIQMDPREFENVIVNLVLNAKDAVVSDGIITLTTRIIPATLHGKPTGVAIEVDDNGCGMTPKVKTQIFLPFFTTKEESPSSGLGLSSSYGIVKKAAGRIEVQSAVNQGTTVTLFFPHEEKGETEADPGNQRAVAQAETILLVSSNDELAKTLKSMLSEGGYRTQRARGTAAALQSLAESSEIGMALVDHSISGHNGGTLAAELRSSTPLLPIIILSSAPTNTDGIQEHYLEKPFSLTELLDAVNTRFSIQSEVSP